MAIYIFFPLIIPLNGHYTAIGNDFIYLYYNYKVYLLDCLSHFRIPLWSPSEAVGYPFYSNPFTQSFYPLNIPLAIYYKLTGGSTPLEHQYFTVLGVSIFSLGLFYWLKSLKLNVSAILFATLVMSVSFKIIEILRFPNAIHTAAWYPWILFSLTKSLQNSCYLKKIIKYNILLIFFIICFFTGGYPYYIYYSIFLFIPYFLTFFIPSVRKIYFVNTVNWKNFFLRFSLPS
ncbi:MAG: hypothetical protein HC877_17075 [Thioploca sp.]|nr:hypothetical protein [Thioploca sp.]